MNEEQWNLLMNKLTGLENILIVVLIGISIIIGQLIYVTVIK